MFDQEILITLNYTHYKTDSFDLSTTSRW